jgi:hypothetical protein
MPVEYLMQHSPAAVVAVLAVVTVAGVAGLGVGALAILLLLALVVVPGGQVGSSNGEPSYTGCLCKHQPWAGGTMSIVWNYVVPVAQNMSSSRLLHPSPCMALNSPLYSPAAVATALALALLAGITRVLLRAPAALLHLALVVVPDNPSMSKQHVRMVCAMQFIRHMSSMHDITCW